MSPVRLLAVGLLLTGFGDGTSQAVPERPVSERVEPNRVAGLWEAVKVDQGTMPVGSTMELMKDGKAKITIKEGGQEMSLMATYTLADGKLTMTAKVGNGEQKQALTIKKLTATELVVSDDKGKTVEFKRKR